ncbi:MAG TPA: LysM domain-containing protein [Nitrolancea sp.]
MEAETGGATRSSCPFADVRPEGCICIALADNKRISVDYQARFCFTENHVRCRRFQRAVPEIPNGEESKSASLIDDPKVVAAVAALSILLFFAIIATAFHGTWTGWFSGNGAGTATAKSAIGSSVSPTSIVIGGSQGTAGPTATQHGGTQVPVLIVTPTPLAATTPTAAVPSPAATTTSVSGTVTATTALPTSTAVPTPTPTPPLIGPVNPNPPVASSNTSSSVGTTGGQGGPSGYVVPPTSYPVNVITASTPAVHIVQPGDTINSIGAAYGVPTVLIAVANNLTDSDLIMPGDLLFIPTPDGHLPPQASLAGVHLVVSGDTMSTIAEAFDVSVQTLMSYNGITDPDLIQVGDIILVPNAATLASVGNQTTDVVQTGDTLSSISQRFGVSVEAIMRANGLADKNTVRAGQVLIIPNA